MTGKQGSGNRNAYCDSNHVLVCRRARLQSRRLNRSKPKGRHRINIAQMFIPSKVK
ncbi:hypothetical protein CHS0354_038146, partial [Potamilus streckersoni]